MRRLRTTWVATHAGLVIGSAFLSIMTDFTDLGKQAAELGRQSKMLRMIVRKLFLELHGIIWS